MFISYCGENVEVASTSTTSTSTTSTTSTSTTSTTSTSTSTTTTSTTTTTIVNKYSVDNLQDAQVVLKSLFLYQGKVDGLNGLNTRNAIKEFQRRAGLITDGILGTNTKSSLEKGKDAYISLSKDDIAYMIIEYSEEFLEAQKTLFFTTFLKTLI